MYDDDDDDDDDGDDGNDDASHIIIHTYAILYSLYISALAFCFCCLRSFILFTFLNVSRKSVFKLSLRRKHYLKKTRLLKIYVCLCCVDNYCMVYIK